MYNSRRADAGSYLGYTRYFPFRRNDNSEMLEVLRSEEEASPRFVYDGRTVCTRYVVVAR